MTVCRRTQARLPYLISAANCSKQGRTAMEKNQPAKEIDYFQKSGKNRYGGVFVLSWPSV